MFLRLLAIILLSTAAATSVHAAAPALSHLIETINGEKPIQLQSLHVSGAITGAMAETTVRMVFFNPNRRPLEGHLQFPLLPGQRITEFSLDVDGKLRPAVPVEKAKGRQVFEEVERRNVDPGLLENTHGDNFKLRIYPIAPRGTRIIELKYAEALTRSGASWAYRLPLAYGDRLQDFDLSLTVHGSSSVPMTSGALGGVNFVRAGDSYQSHVAKSRFTPSGMLNLLLPASQKPQTYIQERGGATYFVAEIPVSVKRTPRRLPRVVGLLWDSSGSGATRHVAREFFELDKYFMALGNVEVRLTRLRDRAEAVETFKIVNGKWDALRSALESTVYDGASALADWQPQADVGEYLLVSDGLLNYGRARFPTLAKGQRLYALSSSLVADTGRLAALAERSGGRLVQVQSDKPGAAAKDVLTDGAHVRTISATGATDVLVDSADPEQGLLRVAGKLTNPTAQLKLTVVEQGKPKTINITVSIHAPMHPLAAHVWAGYKLHALEGDLEANRGEIRRQGTQFGIPTRETSLIVLDRLEDYVRYDLTPPTALLPAFEQLVVEHGAKLVQKRQKHLDSVVEEFKQKVAWWEKTYPKGAAPKSKSEEMDTYETASAAQAAAAIRRSMESRSTQRASTPPPRPTAMHADMVASNAPRAESAPEGTSPTVIGLALKKWTADAPYITRMSAATADTIYAIYLDEKPSYTNSSAFFLDAADMLFDKGRRDLALRVLSNLAEMDLENRQVLRILGYRLLQAGEPGLATTIFEKVQTLAEEEPQSFRDLGLAFAAAGRYQQAIDQLNEVVKRPWGDRFAEIEMIALAEMNAIIASAPNQPAPLDTSRIDSRLLKNLPLDLRAVLAWDADNSDMDLWVIDPNGEKCYYAHRFTYQGGRMSRDFTGGYGPEEFSLRQAKPGKYRIEANFYGSRQQVVAGATTLQVKLTSGFGTDASKDQMITLRLKGKGETIFVGEFEVKPK